VALEAAGDGARSEAVLLLHGLWLNRFAMHYLVHALGRQGYRASAVGYRSLSETLDEHVALLARRVAATAADVVHLAGHSLGGLVVFRYLQGAADPRVGRAVLLGTPVSGCLIAQILEKTATGRFLLGRSASAWRAPFEPSLDRRFEIGVIAGTRRFGLACLFARLPRANDGVVLLEETRFPGMRDHLSLAISHSAMLVSRRVARQVGAFLRKGEFLR
jgi:pimeloyl-ACP methyl ester carboxylesterase